LNMNELTFMVFTNDVILNINMFCTTMKFRIGNKPDGTLSI
jgi:hypothetical protein